MGKALVAQARHRRHRLLDRAAGAKAVTLGFEFGLEQRPQQFVQGGMNHPVAHARDGQWPRPAVALGDDQPA